MSVGISPILLAQATLLELLSAAARARTIAAHGGLLWRHARDSDVAGLCRRLAAMKAHYSGKL
jgi:hypothetical protein